MKLLKLLEGLYQELKTFNENVEYFSLLEKEKKHRHENPLMTMSDIELAGLKIWIRKCLEKEGIALDGSSYSIRSTEKFIDERHRCSTKETRNFLSAALGYDSFNKLLEAYKQEKGTA